MLPNEPQSYVTFMNENLFNHVDVPKENIHIPDGSIKEEEVAEFCKEYEQKINAFGGLDIQVLGSDVPDILVLTNQEQLQIQEQEW